MEHNVAGTIVMNSSDGEKLFLVQKEADSYMFASTKVCPNKTGLACILEFFKDQLKINLEKIGLVELSNATIDSQSLPIFVFEIEETDVTTIENADFVWETPATLREVLEKYDVNGVPMFQ